MLGRSLLLASALIVGCGPKGPAPAGPPPLVQVAPVRQADVPVVREWVATLDGLVNAVIDAQVTGYLLKRTYREGSFVRAGDPLFEIDDRPFAAALEAAKAELARAGADKGKTELDVRRYRPLAETQAIARQELDNAIQADLGASARVQAARASLRRAEIDLGFTKIASPIDGIAGLAKAQVGDLVAPGGPELTTVSTVDPIRAFFSVSEQQYLAHVARRRSEGKGDEEPGAGIELTLVLSDGSVYPARGWILFADRQVDPRTGTVRVAGAFPNPDRTLKPGMFARVQATVDLKRGALILPQRAVLEVQGRNLAAVVTPEGTVSMRPVRIGVRVGPDCVAEEGLRPGDRVVAEGLQKVRDGLKVRVEPYAPELPPAAETPAEVR
jgi:membrane fusion protein (multidrug efflux system)